MYTQYTGTVATVSASTILSASRTAPAMVEAGRIQTHTRQKRVLCAHAR